MGNPFKKPKPPPPPKVDPAIEKAKKEEEKRKLELEMQQESFDARKARGMVGSRSLFGKAGGKGYLS
tara:strand:- start:120 stop:320 length:201 start_codon:yes stop_codon:yes gene_type:complete